jgi:hypothetical protein
LPPDAAAISTFCDEHVLKSPTVFFLLQYTRSHVDEGIIPTLGVVRIVEYM